MVHFIQELVLILVLVVHPSVLDPIHIQVVRITALQTNVTAEIISK